MVKRSLSSHLWLKRQQHDPFVKSAKQQGYRARSAFKLLEIFKRYPQLKRSRCVVDLGCAPGAWSQVVVESLHDQTMIVGVDLLPMDDLNGVEFILGDFRDQAILKTIRSKTQGRDIDLILSDMAPNMTGIKSVDLDRSMHLCELTMDFALVDLAKKGNLVSKIFIGRGFDDLFASCRKSFKKVITFKPHSSRQHSREMYLIALNKQ